MYDDEVQAEIRRAWDNWQDKLTPDDMRFLRKAAADVAVLAIDERVRARFHDALTRFAAQYAAFRTAREAWDANPHTWRAEMGRPINPLGALWPYTYGTGWKGWQDLEPAGRGRRAWNPLLCEIEKEVPMILGLYALLAVIHDKILPQSPRINDGFLPEDFAQKIWWSFLNDVDNWGITGGRAQYVINKRHVEGALARVTQDAKSEPQRAPIGKHEEKLSGPGQAGETETASVSNRRFAVALSFPGKRRDFVEGVASRLAGQVGKERVLYDKYHEAEFAQPDLDVYLPNLYSTESELIVIFLCADYAKKRWCKLEWRFIRQLISTSESRRIMFVSFDEIGAVPELGISLGDGYASVDSRSPDEIGTLILRRLERNRQKEKLDIGGAPRVTSVPIPQGSTNANMRPTEWDRVKAHLPEQGTPSPPTDLISSAVAVKDYSVSRATLRRAVAETRLRDYRPEGHSLNAPLRLSRAEVANIWPRRGQ